MAKGKKTGGRQKGTLNKNKAQALEEFQSRGFDPYNSLIIGLGNQAEAIKSQPEYMQADSYAKLNELYLKLYEFFFPKKKAEDVTVSGSVLNLSGPTLNKADMISMIKTARGIKDE
jgi:hypothetical protein